MRVGGQLTIESESNWVGFDEWMDGYTRICSRVQKKKVCFLVNVFNRLIFRNIVIVLSCFFKNVLIRCLRLGS